MNQHHAQDRFRVGKSDRIRLIRELVVQAAKKEAICLIASSSLNRALLQIKSEVVSFLVTLLLVVSFFKGVAFMDLESLLELQPVNNKPNTSKSIVTQQNRIVKKNVYSRF